MPRPSRIALFLATFAFLLLPLAPEPFSGVAHAKNGNASKGAEGNGGGNGKGNNGNGKGNGGSDGGSGGGTGGGTGGGSGGGSGGTPAGPPVNPPESAPIHSGSDGSVLSDFDAPLAERLDRLAPYAEALLVLSRAQAELIAAQGEVDRLQGLSWAERARAFAADGPSFDRGAWQADIDRLAPFAEDHARLATLDDADKAQLFPRRDDTGAVTGHDEAAYQRTLARYARAAADHVALSALPEDRLQQLYPAVPSPSGFDRALAAAKGAVAPARARLAAARAEVDLLQAMLIGPRPLTPAEAAYLNAYLNGG